MKSVKGRGEEGHGGQGRGVEGRGEEHMIPSGGKRELSGICGSPGLAGSAMKSFTQSL